MDIFDASKIFRWGKKYDFMKANNIKEPTAFAKILAGDFLLRGHEVVLEQRVSKISVDLYVPTWSKTTMIEVIGDNRTKEQREQDENRDMMLSCNGFDTYRFNNEKIRTFYDDLVYKWFVGSNHFEEQLVDWMNNGIPNLIAQEGENPEIRKTDTDLDLEIDGLDLTDFPSFDLDLENDNDFLQGKA